MLKLGQIQSPVLYLMVSLPNSQCCSLVPLITSRQLPPFSPAQSHTRRRRREGEGRNLYSCSKRRPRPSIHRVRNRHRMTSHRCKTFQGLNPAWSVNDLRPSPAIFQAPSPASSPPHLPSAPCCIMHGSEIEKERGRNSFGGPDRPPPSED